MKDAKALKSFAKKLVGLSVENSCVSEERVSAVLQTLLKKPSRDLKPLLKFYLNYIRQEVAKTQASLDYAGVISEETIASLEKEVAKHYNRPIELHAEEKPELLAGLRMRVGDDVWERSAANILHTLKQSF